MEINKIIRFFIKKTPRESAKSHKIGVFIINTFYESVKNFRNNHSKIPKQINNKNINSPLDNLLKNKKQILTNICIIYFLLVTCGDKGYMQQLRVCDC